MFWVRLALVVGDGGVVGRARCASSLTRPAFLSLPRSQYGVLDFLVKVCWLFAFLFGIEGLDYSRFGFVRPLPLPLALPPRARTLTSLPHFSRTLAALGQVHRPRAGHRRQLRRPRRRAAHPLGRRRLDDDGRSEHGRQPGAHGPRPRPRRPAARHAPAADDERRAGQGRRVGVSWRGGVGSRRETKRLWVGLGLCISVLAFLSSSERERVRVAARVSASRALPQVGEPVRLWKPLYGTISKPTDRSFHSKARARAAAVLGRCIAPGRDSGEYNKLEYTSLESAFEQSCRRVGVPERADRAATWEGPLGPPPSRRCLFLAERLALVSSTLDCSLGSQKRLHAPATRSPSPSCGACRPSPLPRPPPRRRSPTRPPRRRSHRRSPPRRSTSAPACRTRRHLPVWGWGSSQAEDEQGGRGSGRGRTKRTPRSKSFLADDHDEGSGTPSCLSFLRSHCFCGCGPDWKPRLISSAVSRGSVLGKSRVSAEAPSAPSDQHRRARGEERNEAHSG